MAIKSIILEIQASNLKIKVFMNRQSRADHYRTMECYRDTRGPLRGSSYPLAPEGPLRVPQNPDFWIEAFKSASKILTHHQYNLLGPQSNEGLMDFIRPPRCYPRGAWNYQNAINFIQERGGQRCVLKALFYFSFLVATKRLYMSVCPSVRPLVRRSVGWLRFRFSAY